LARQSTFINIAVLAILDFPINIFVAINQALNFGKIKEFEELLIKPKVG